MTIKEARRCGMKLNEIKENSDIYVDMKNAASTGDVKSMMDFGMWNEIQGDMCQKLSEYYYYQALYWYKRAWDPAWQLPSRRGVVIFRFVYYYTTKGHKKTTDFQ